MTLRITAALLFAVLFVTVLAMPAGANLLANGSFESWSGGDQSSSSQPDRIFNDGSLVVSGWNFAIGLSSDLYRDLNASGALSNYYDASDGDYLAGSGSFFTLHEGISQTFTAAPSSWYLLTFDMAPGGLNYDGSWIENATVGSSWKVDLTGALPNPITQTYNTNLAHFNASGTTNPLVWTSKSLLFQSDAVGGNVTVLFSAYGDLTHVFLDNVAVNGAEAPVPEPASGLLAVLAMIGIALVGRRLRRGS